MMGDAYCGASCKASVYTTNTLGDTCIHLAAEGGHVDVIDFLIRVRANTTAIGKIPARVVSLLASAPSQLACIFSNNEHGKQTSKQSMRGTSSIVLTLTWSMV